MINFPQVKLSEVANINMGTAPAGSSYNMENIGLPLVGGASDFSEIFPKPKKYTTEPQKISQEGDILICVRATIGNLNLSDKQYAIGRGVAAITPTNSIDKNYLWYWLLNNKGYFTSLGKGSTFLQITSSDLKNANIPLFSLEKQKSISHILREADLLLRKRQQSINLTDEYIKSIFLKMFGDPISNQKGWNKKKLEEFGEIITGNTPSRADEKNYSDKFIEWVKTDNIKEDETYITQASEYLSEIGLTKGRYVNSGAVLVACIAGSIESIGRTAIVDRKVAFNQQINAIQPNQKVNSLFLYWLLKLSRNYIQDHATKGMKRILTKGEFKEISMIFPSIDLQNKFGKIAERSNNLKIKMTEQSKELDNHFQALMQKYFSVI